MSRYYRTIVVLGIVLVASTSAHAAIVLQDDFNDDSLDPAKWLNVGGLDGQVVESSGSVQTVYNSGRAWLVSAEQWNPANGAITITGQVSVPNYFEVWSRAVDTLDTAGQPNSGGVLAAGVLGYNYGPAANELGILTKTDTVWPWTSVGQANVVTHATAWDFIYTDNGSNISFTITQVGNALNTSTVNAITNHGSGEYHLAFSVPGGTIDNIVVTQAPEPSAFFAMACGLLGLVGAFRRRKR